MRGLQHDVVLGKQRSGVLDIRLRLCGTVGADDDAPAVARLRMAERGQHAFAEIAVRLRPDLDTELVREPRHCRVRRAGQPQQHLMLRSAGAAEREFRQMRLQGGSACCAHGGNQACLGGTGNRGTRQHGDLRPGHQRTFRYSRASAAGSAPRQ